MENHSDKELIALFKAGNEHAFDVIYKRHHKPLFVFTQRLLKDRDAAADLVQEVFVKLWEHSQVIPQDVNLKAYLYSMTRNKVINHIRNNRSRLLNNYRIVQETEESVDMEIWDRMEENARIRMFQDAVEALPPQQKKVIEFRINGMTNKEIAEKMHLSLNTVNVHYRLGMKAIREKMTIMLVLMILLW